MNNEQLFYQAMETVTGLGKEDFQEYQDTNLFESTILDSISLAGLLSEISNKADVTLKMDQFSAEDFVNINALCEKVLCLLK